MAAVAARFSPCALTIIAIIATAVFLNPTVAHAQDERPSADISDRQADLNEEGVRAVIRGDHETGVALLSESLAYGEANVTYLNLGRAYQKLGNCAEAKKALRKAKTAPAVDEPPPDLVDKKADQYLEELAEKCDSGDEAPKTDADEESGDEPTDTDDGSVTPPPESKGASTDGGGSSTWGWITLASGAAIAGAGIYPHVLAAQERAPVRDAEINGRVIDFDDQEAARRRQKANMLNSVGLGMNIAGVVLAGVGTYLLVSTGSGEAQQPTEDAPRLILRATPDGAHGAIRITF